MDRRLQVTICVCGISRSGRSIEMRQIGSGTMLRGICFYVISILSILMSSSGFSLYVLTFSMF